MASNKKSGLLEGFVRGSVDGVRRYFARSPERASNELRRGGTPSVSRAGLPYTMASQFGYDNLTDHLRIDRDLMTRYADYEEMDETVEVSVALDIYADDATTPDLSTGRSIWATSPDHEVQKDLNNLLHKRLGLDEDIWGSVRTLSKYGSNFGEILVSERGVVGLQYMPPPTVRRVEDPRGNLIGYIQDVRGEFNVSVEDYYKLAKMRQQQPYGRAPGEMVAFEDWEVAHWRLRGKHMNSVYGHGVAEAARYAWKRLQLLEDALLIYKLERSPSRYLFKVDIGKMDATRGMAHINRVKSQFKRKRFVNPKTGKLDMRFNPLGMDEDIFVGSRDGRALTEIEALQGPDYSEVETLEYHRGKMVTALKMPKAYMGYADGDTRNALSSDDIRFARTTMRVQAAERAGWRKVARVHMLATNRDPDKVEYDVAMSVPSQIMELAKLEVMSAKADLASRMGEIVDSRWILTSLFGFTESDAEKVMKDKREEKLDGGKVDAAIAKMSEGATGFSGPRLSEMVRATPKESWEKEFDASRKSDRRLDAKMEDLIKGDARLAKKLRDMDGLLRDVRSALSVGGR